MSKKKMLLIASLLVLLSICCCFGILAVGASKDNDSLKNDSSQTSNSDEETPSEVLNVEIGSFIKEFDENQLAAEKKYKNKIVKFTGFIDNISEDILGDTYLSINPTNDEYYFDTSIQCYFKSSDSVLSLKNGQQVNLEGRVESQTLGLIQIKNCSVK